MKLALTIDARDEKELERILTKRFHRYYFEQANPEGLHGVEAKTAHAVRQAKAQAKKLRDHRAVKMHFTVDLAALRLTYLKIAYEMCWYHFGPAYLENIIASRIRDAINERQKEPLVHGQVPFHHDGLSKLTLAENCHSVMLTGNSCYMNMFGLAGVVEMCEEDGNFHVPQEDGIIYHFNYVNRTVVITSLAEHLGTLDGF